MKKNAQYILAIKHKEPKSRPAAKVLPRIESHHLGDGVPYEGRNPNSVVITCCEMLKWLEYI